MYRMTIAAALVSMAAAGAAAASERTRLEAAARIVHDIRPDIPADYWNRARCIAVVPDLKKAAFIIGGEYGKGVMSCRAGERWSAPVFMQLAKGSWGFQAGAQQIDLVLLVMNESGVQKLLENKVTLGADASIAAGPLGRHGSVGTDIALRAEILSYSRAQGLFAGIDLSGGVLRPDEDANREVYGPDASPRRILASRDISAPPEATPFLQALGAGAAAPSAATSTEGDRTARSSPPEPRTTTRSTTDDDLRAQVVAMQETIDRLLADTTPSPVVGTSGTAGAATRPDETVVVDRGRLIQLRRQLESLLAALNKR
jgi:SH3 domain-containing YSC84-like protein 1